MTLFDPSVEAPPAAPSGPLVRVRMTVAYDGSGFHGFAMQDNRPDLRTVGGVLTETIRTVTGAPVKLAVAGRTDRGVHAWGQVVTFDAPAATDLAGLTRSVNKMLGPAVAVRDVTTAADDFHARHSATARRYRYTVLNRPAPDPFLAATTWWVEAPLDLRSMQLACDPLIGEHDYSSFCRKPPDDGHMVRRVHDARWRDLGDGLLRFDIEANAFCHQMVRSLVGTLVAVGHGKRRAGDLAGILRSGSREGLPSPAPPQGLCLWEVLY